MSIVKLINLNKNIILGKAAKVTSPSEAVGGKIISGAFSLVKLASKIVSVGPADAVHIAAAGPYVDFVVGEKSGPAFPPGLHHCRSSSSTSPAHGLVRVSLPHQTTAIALEVFWYRLDSTEAFCELKRQRTSGNDIVQTLGYVSLTSGTGYLSTKATINQDYSIIDNNNYNYYLKFKIDPVSDSCDILWLGANVGLK